ncbi:hypothetical protein LMH66_14795 [Shewanella sp. 10N.7]|uniref:hypothetical protein n=1 Tax=Shewanella sp. 10N.7 TaxID=2885093 RepID=UPI001E2BD0B4|nr:hypothetical protein [Shewanella sp. 10N.7]MCC4833910.1 hypothetical protein [Shewanella sp. 10N.7]
MKKLLILTLLLAFSPFLLASEPQLYCQYFGESDGEQMQLEVTNEKLMWTEILPQHGVQKQNYDRIHSEYGADRYAGKDGSSFFTIQKSNNNLWDMTVALFFPDGSLYTAFTEKLVCVGR